MKKLLILFAFLFASISVWSEQDKILKYDFGISTGIPVYSRNDESVFTEESRVIIGTTADVSLQLIKPLRFLVGTDVCADFMWNSDEHNYHLDYSFWSGIKFFPGFGGLNLSIAYALGSRTDFIKTCDKSIESFEYNGNSYHYINKETDSYIESTAWGNGFRISIDYDFSYENKLMFLPALGGYYRCMPRGNNNWDNIFAVYVSFSF